MSGIRGMKVFVYGLLLASSPLAITAATAQSDSSIFSGTNWLDTIIVTGTKTEHKVIDEMSGSSVVTQDEMETIIQPNDINDILRHIPGVEVMMSGEGAESSINIRGMQDYGRVNVMIDGARQNWAMQGHYAQGAFFLDPEILKSVDVTRGPVATIYGSGAIGGVVNFVTKDASDMLLPGQTMGATFKGSFHSIDQTKLLSGSAYASMGGFDILASIVYRDRENYTDGGGVEHLQTDSTAKNALFKGSYSFGDGQKITASALLNRTDFIDGKDYTPIFGPFFGDTRRINEVEADTYKLVYDYSPSNKKWIDLHASGYITNTDKLQTFMGNSTFYGTSGGDSREINIETKGYDIFNTSRFETGNFGHALTYGTDGVMDEKRTIDPVGTGVAGHTPSGDRDVFGGFIQDEISYGGWLDLTFAARYDTYEMSSSTTTGVKTTNSGDYLSPKATLGITPKKGIQFFATYAEAFRAPSITEALMGGSHGGSFTYIPNPDLEAETARNWEGGVNLKFDNLLLSDDTFRAKAVYFHNDVDDYIGQVSVGPNRQYQNISQVRMTGFELEANYDAEWMFASATYSRIRGDNRATNEPLLTIAPDKYTGMIGFRIKDGANRKITFGGRVIVIADQKRVPSGSDEGEGYTLVNLFSDFEVTERLKISIGVDNLFDKEYTPYLDMDIGNRAGRGRNVKLTTRVKF